MRRLYIGGLSHSITEKDLKDRFGKFGSVEDVELRTRRDGEGVPYKTFGYININISDADLKKCFTVLNKSKWKGGTLQIEMAKESFLHRLAEERQVAAEQCLQQPAVEDTRQKMLDSMSKAGVDNFTMKAAVPGTEIPGHKDWIVSKFGRVLPVLQLKCQKGNKARTLKYDPSKYTHNIRKLDRDATDEPTPVTQLTWEEQGGDDDISKKRRGEFPPYEPPRPKKIRKNVVSSRPMQAVAPVNHTENHQFTNGFKPSTNQRPVYRRGVYLNDSDVDSDEEIRRLVAAQQTSHSLLQRDMEDDNLEVVGLDFLVKSEHKDGPDDKDEDDYDSADTDELFASRKPPPLPQQREPAPLTTEHISKNNTDTKRITKRKKKAVEQKEEKETGEEDSSDAQENLTSRKPSSIQQRVDAAKQSSLNKSDNSENLSRKITIQPLSESDSDEEDEDDVELESADSCSDSDYEAMFSNVTHLEISLADLQRLAEETQKTSETTAPNVLGTSPKQETNLTAKQPAPRKGNLPEEILAAIMEDDRSDDEQKKKTKKRKGVLSTPLPAFQGTRAFNEEKEMAFVQGHNKEGDGKDVVKKQKLDPEALHLNPTATDSKTSSEHKRTETEQRPETRKVDNGKAQDEEQENKQKLVKNMAATKVLINVPTKVTTEKAKNVTFSSSESDEEEEEEEEWEKMKATKTIITAKAAANASPSSSSSSSEDDEEKQDILAAKRTVKTAPPTAHGGESSSGEKDEKKEKGLPRILLKAEDEEELQRKANLRRLAAIQQRQKEAEEHKKLIQGALANLDVQKAGAGKHIVFGSDNDEDEDEEEEDKQQTVTEVSALKKSLFQGSQSEDESTSDEPSTNRNRTIKEKVHLKSSGPQLFNGSEDEDSGDEEEDDSRFDIRPQFEGRAGQKLMELQSRFGTDERFRMDSRFLEEDEKEEEESEKKKSVTGDEEALEEERKKNLEILQSVLGSSQQTCSKTASKAKTFRDVSALHYDPSKKEHSQFETTTDETKESKSSRRKKREEAQKLPDVSKEIYFDISGDLKAVFGQTKSDVAEQEQKTSWDQEEEEDVRGQEEQLPLQSSVVMADPIAVKEESTGFKFSFFGDDTETETQQTEEYKVESIQAPKVSWQQDMRFQDSSSDEDEEEQEEEEEKTSTATKIREEETPSKMDVFFFYPEDSRLTEGPRLFYRSSQLEEQREQWEERRNALRQEYRKKHKDARRKLRSSQKT